ncbi:Hypothetical predicted protein [Pelobates cultripes]|uniref:Uncharacterized protein n=1 Tax=Pelobates cultripes TaxID=61616 RepID=A0AAD1RJB1_PELCU|nr:Hypothetical predicted protein [Pelobates cultripes]
MADTKDTTQQCERIGIWEADFHTAVDAVCQRFWMNLEAWQKSSVLPTVKAQHSPRAPVRRPSLRRRTKKAHVPASRPCTWVKHLRSRSRYALPVFVKGVCGYGEMVPVPTRGCSTIWH